MILCARTQRAAFYSGHSGQSPLVLNHIEPHYKDKVGSIPRRPHHIRKSSTEEMRSYRYRSDRGTLTSPVTATISTVTNRKHATRMAHQKRLSEDWEQFVDCYWTIVLGVFRSLRNAFSLLKNGPSGMARSAFQRAADASNILRCISSSKESVRLSILRDRERIGPN